MRTQIIVSVITSCIMLSACDLVRLPSGSGTTGKTATIETDTSPSAPGTEIQPIEGAESLTAPPAADTQTATDIAITPTTGTSEAIEVGPSPASPVTDLVQINAQFCGLAVQPIDGSPTLAEMTGARPSDTDTVSTATINGESARLLNFPGLVKMEPRAFRPSGAIASGHCGATRIAHDWFITAAHCLDDDYDEVQLIAGAETLSSPWAQRVSARAAFCHAAYEGAGGGYANDIALVRIESETANTLDVVPVMPLTSTTATLVPFNYAEAEMAGWGLTQFNGRLSDTLLSAQVQIDQVGPAALRVRSTNGAGPCIGDSGGPLFVRETDGTQRVVGVLSVVEQNTETGGFCEGDYGARYTNLIGYSDWIERVMAACDASPAICGL